MTCAGPATAGSTARFRTLVCGVAVAVIASIVGYEPAVAAPRVVDLQQISAADPFAGSTCGRHRGPRDTALEPYVAVNPRNFNDIEGAWIQDFGKTNMSAYSKDGGATWTRVPIAGVDDCTGGVLSGNYDPWLSFGPDGALYTSNMSGGPPPAGSNPQDPTGTVPQDSVLVNHSNDGGASWLAPAQAEPANGYNDKPAVLADPSRPGRVFVIWAQKTGPEGQVELAERIAVSNDGGATFAPSHPIYTPLPGTVPDGNQLLRGSGGALLYVVEQTKPQNSLPLLPPVDLPVTVLRSTDNGLTWSGPIDIGVIPGTNAVVDPDTGHRVVDGDLPVMAVGPQRAAYVAWTITDGPSRSAVMFARSADDGLTWSTPRALAAPVGQSFLPAVAVMADGTIGVAWYDTRNDKKGDGQLTTDRWLAYSRDQGRTWQQIHFAGPFDMNTAWPDVRDTNLAHTLGDYTSLVAMPDGFASVFIMSRPQVTLGKSQAFFARVRMTEQSTQQQRALQQQLTLRVSSHRARTGRRTRFRFRVTQRNRPVPGAHIQLGGRSTTTGGDGRATLIVTLRRRGTHIARATKPPARSATVRIRVG